MWVWVDRLSATLLDASLAAAIVLGLCALLMVACRQPARRCSLARAAFLAALALLPLVALRPSNRLRIPVLRPIRTLAAPLWNGTLAPGAATFSSSPASQNGLTAWTASFRGALGQGQWPARLLTIAYVSGTSMALGWLALGWLVSWRLCAMSVAPSPGALEIYVALPFAGWRWRRPRLLLCNRVGRPVLLGILRPTILIPPSFDRFESQECLRLSLLHELAHAERGDAWFGLAGHLGQAAWFFLPWVWWMGRQMRLDQEFLADHRASRGFGAFGAYASSLVELAAPDPADHAHSAEATPRSSVPWWGAGSALFQRVLMLVRCPYPVETVAPHWWRWSMPMLVAFATAMASGLTLHTAPPTAAGAIADPTDHAFHLARLVVAEAPAGPDGRTPAYNLPFALPTEFTISLELWAEPADLPHTRVASQALGAEPIDRNEPAGWHAARILRKKGRTTVEVDGRALPAEPRESPIPSWLSVQPAPGKLGLYRNIRVEW